MTALREALIRLTSAGVICGVLLSLAGKKAQKEVLRFGCACFMVILLMTILRNMEWPAHSLAQYQSRVEQVCEDAETKARAQLLTETESRLAEWIRVQGEALGLRCQGTVVCRAENGYVFVEWAEITFFGGESGARQSLVEAVSEQMAVDSSHIAVREG